MSTYGVTLALSQGMVMVKFSQPYPMQAYLIALLRAQYFVLVSYGGPAQAETPSPPMHLELSWRRLNTVVVLNSPLAQCPPQYLC